MNLLLAAETCPAGNPGCFVVPSFEELFNLPPIFGSGLFAFNRVSMLYLLAAIAVSVLLVVAFRAPRIVPGKLQGIMEAVVDFVREQIVMEVIGPKGLKYLPLLVAMFLFIAMNNFFEVVPILQFPPTGRMAMPLLLAILVYVLYWFLAFKTQGLAYIKNTAIPSGVPAYVLPLVIPIELMQVLIVRPASLAIRLFANMMAGHILLTIVFIASSAFLVDVHGLYSGLSGFGVNLRGLPIGIFAFAAGPAVVAFEMMIGLLQAYIFTILTAVYIDSSVNPAH